MTDFWEKIKISLTGRQQGTGQRLFTFVLIAALLTGIIFLSNMAAQAVKKLSVHQANTMMTSIQQNVSFADVENVVGTKNMIRLMKSYAQALAGATIEFEELPDYDITIFFTIAKAIPESVEVDSFQWDGGNIMVDCFSPDSESADEMYYALEKSEYFQSIHLSLPVRESGVYHFQFHLSV